MNLFPGVDKKALLAISVTLIFWASSFAGNRAGLESYSPGAMILLRFLTASAVLGTYAWFTRGIRWPRKSDLGWIIFGGAIGITAYHTLLANGQLTVTAGSASFIIGAVPIFTGLLAAITLHEKLTVRQWIGIAVSFSGIVLIAFGEGGHLEFETGALLILLAALSTSIFFVIQKRLLKYYKPLEVTCYSFWAGTALMLVFLPDLVRDLPSAAAGPTTAVIYLGIFPAALAYLTWNYVFTRTTASVATSFMYLNPIVATLIAFVWLGEIPSAIAALGGLLALTGVIITARSVR
ncbi:MAG: DMT family transporter [Dehalogenimonas sp.]|uniref:DMT family transporter n=1 Tax=Candidatus Dehalogenimonas loeffleri TaxID=3127115 RepID=A0ABZ2J2H2_9CHLR|nr:DMT family transporter [Dehalogenimonas sp.]